MAKGMMEPSRIYQNPYFFPEILARSLIVTLLTLYLTACTSLGEKFALENAINVKNGMTRDQVITIMGSPPSEIEGHDRGYLLWLYSSANPVFYGVETQKVMFILDETGRVYGISGGVFSSDRQHRPADRTEQKIVSQDFHSDAKRTTLLHHHGSDMHHDEAIPD